MEPSLVRVVGSFVLRKELEGVAIGAIGPGDKRKEAKRNKVVQLLTWNFTGGNGGRFCLQSTVEQFCGSVYVLNTGLATHRKPLVTCK